MRSTKTTSTGSVEKPSDTGEKKQSASSKSKKEEYLYDKFLDIPVLKQLLQERDPNENQNGYNGLHAAAEFTIDTEERISLLIEHGTDLNSQDKNTPHKNTPLQVLIINARKKEAIFYIEQANKLNKKINYNIQDSQGKSALLMAVKTHQAEVALAIIDQLKFGIDVNLNLADNDGYTPLHYACTYGMLEIAKALIEHGAKLNPTTKTLKKPIDLTVSDEKTISSFLQSVAIEPKRDENASYNGIKDHNFQPILAYSGLAKKEFPEILSIKKNKDQVAKILSEGIIDTTALAQNKIQKLQDEKISKKILEQFDHFTGRSLLEKCQASQDPVKKYLIQQGADFGWLIRFLAAKAHNIELKNLLENPESKKYINQPGMPSGKTALHQAVINNHLITCELLLEKKAEINSVDKEGNTSLHLAIIGSRVEVISLLVKNRADLNIKNKEGKSPLDLILLPKYSKAKLIIDEWIENQKIKNQSIVFSS